VRRRAERYTPEAMGFDHIVERGPNRSPGPATWLPVLLPVAVGVLLRLHGLSEQIIGGDELHSVDAALRLSLPRILTTYEVADNCMPWTAYLHLLLQAGVGLTEKLVRLPSLVAGLVSLLVIPVVLARRIGRAEAVLFAWLVALSPTFIYYSRVARPYTVVVLLGFVSVACFWRWWELERTAVRGRERRWIRWGWAAGYAVSGALASWFHPASGPFVAAPLAFTAGEILLRHWQSRSWIVQSPSVRVPSVVRLLAPTGLLSVLVAAYLVPAGASFLEILRMKAEGKAPDWKTLTHGALLAAGTVSPAVAVGFWLLAAVGLAVLARTKRRLALYSVILVAMPVVALLVMQPRAVRVPVIALRYVLVALPAVLLWVASGLVALWRLRPRGKAVRLRWAGPLGAAALVCAWCATHPYVTDPALRFGPFAGSTSASSWDRPVPVLPPKRVPEVYRLIAREPGDRPVVAVGSDFPWPSSRLDQALWRVHRRPVIVASFKHWLLDPRLRFTTLVPATPEAIAASTGRFVILHLDRATLAIVEEEQRTGWRRPLLKNRYYRRMEHFRKRARNILTEAWGPPAITGPGLLVWDLETVARTARSAAARGGGSTTSRGTGGSPSHSDRRGRS